MHTWPQIFTVIDPVKIDSLRNGDKPVKVQGIKYSYEWTIDVTYKRTLKSNDAVLSPTFSVGSNNEFEAYLKIYPKGTTGAKPDYASIYLDMPYQLNQVGVSATATCMLLRTDNQTRFLQEAIKLVPETFRAGYGWGYSDFFQYARDPDTGDKLLSHKVAWSNKARKIRCEIELLMDISRPRRTDGVNIGLPQKDLLDGIVSLYTDGLLTDITFVVSGNKLTAHKAILAAHSVVFRAMFQSGMVEANTNMVKITDASVDVFKDFLLFIYTGQVACLDTLGEELLGLAEKYAMQGLKTICEKSLGKNLSVNNAAKTFLVAHQYQAKQLEDEAVQFILRHRKQVKNTEEWKSLKKDHALVFGAAFLE